MNGKDKCKLLKTIRRQIAEQYGLNYQPTECHHKGECSGTCPRCDAEVQDLLRQLEEMGIHDIDLNTTLRKQVDEFGRTALSRNDDIRELQEEDSTLTNELAFQGCPPLLPYHLEGIPQEFIPKKRKVFFKECPIAGWSFHNPEDFWYDLYEGAELALIREKNNKYDPNAVAVAFADDFDDNLNDFDFDAIIGYIPRTENKFIAQMIDLGWNNVFTAVLTTLKDYGAYNDRLRMTIYMQSKDAEIENERQPVYAQIMDDVMFKDFTDTLYQQGYVYFRWGGFPPWEHDLPNEGEKVIFIHQEKKTTTLYLMHLVAKGDNAAPFLKNPEEELDIIDDCCPYVLTNIKGPVECASEELFWLPNEKLSDDQPENRLSDYAVDRLKDIFEKEN